MKTKILILFILILASGLACDNPDFDPDNGAPLCYGLEGMEGGGYMINECNGSRNGRPCVTCVGYPVTGGEQVPDRACRLNDSVCEQVPDREYLCVPDCSVCDEPYIPCPVASE